MELHIHYLCPYAQWALHVKALRDWLHINRTKLIKEISLSAIYKPLRQTAEPEGVY